MPRVVRRSHGVAAQGVIAEDGRRGHEHEAGNHVFAEASRRHRRHNAALGVPEQRNVADLRQPARIGNYRHEIIDFVEHRHVAEAAFAFAVSVEVEADGAHADIGKGIGHRLNRGTGPVARKAVAQNDERHRFTGLHRRKAHFSLQLSHGTRNAKSGGGLGIRHPASHRQEPNPDK